jgi:hypothetical protein
MRNEIPKQDIFIQKVLIKPKIITILRILGLELLQKLLRDCYPLDPTNYQVGQFPNEPKVEATNQWALFPM